MALRGAGAGVLKDIDLMVRLTSAVVKSTSLPVTVKTRLGWDFDSINIEEVAERLQDVGIKALSIHGRTRSQRFFRRVNIAITENRDLFHFTLFNHSVVPRKLTLCVCPGLLG